ncbi:hypothetical protein B2J88_43215 [Rhodococcus sp. SRB_17]|nr:hypothetical protein [Rhodococcus sp. SRB_17]
MPDPGSTTTTTADVQETQDPQRVPEGPKPDFDVSLISEADLQDAEATTIQSYSRAGTDDDQVIVHFLPNASGCLGAHTSVVETETTVRISLVTGTPVESAQHSCTPTGTLASIIVPLKAPLGPRGVLNG